MQGFKDFIMRGNLIELAIAFIMGAAFSTVVTAFTNIVLSLISLVLGGPPNFDSYAPGGVPVGAFITQLISFLIVALVVYYGLAKPAMSYRDRTRKTESEEAVELTELDLLTDIRDLLATKQS